MNLKRRLQLGCGNDARSGWINHDVVPLDGVDVVHNLNDRPWPWEDNEFEEVYAKDVLEHLADTVGTMEEIYRITKPDALIYIAVPYWNSWEAITDPTHLRQFNEFTFNFFDPTKEQCQERPYYSNARFIIEKIGFGIQFPPYLHTERRLFWKIPGGIPPFKYTVYFHPIPKWILGLLASFFNNVIVGLEVYLKRDNR